MARRQFLVEDFMKFKFVYNPQISPDGKKILYVVCGMEDEKYLPNIWIYDSEQCINQQFTFANSDDNPVWSPDGSKIAFTSKRSGKQQLYLMPANGGEAQPLVQFRYGVNKPAWSPCGKKIAFTAALYNTQSTAELLSLTEDDRDEGLKKQHKIARRVDKLFYKSDGCPGAGLIDNKNTHIFVIDLDTENIEQITKGAFNAQDPSWSPNGDSLVFCANMARDIVC